MKKAPKEWEKIYANDAGININIQNIYTAHTT